MALKKKPDVNPTFAAIVEKQRGQILSITGMMLDACQFSLRRDQEYRHFFGLDMMDCDMLRDAPPEQLYYISQRCLFPFRPSRPIKDMLANGQVLSEYSVTARFNANEAANVVFTNMKIMWSIYVLSMQRLINEHKEAWVMLGITAEDAAVLCKATPNVLHTMALNGPYALTPSACLRGLLGPRRVLRPDELLRRCAMDMSVTQTKTATTCQRG